MRKFLAIFVVLAFVLVGGVALGDEGDYESPEEIDCVNDRNIDGTFNNAHCAEWFANLPVDNTPVDYSDVDWSTPQINDDGETGVDDGMSDYGDPNGGNGDDGSDSPEEN